MQKVGYRICPICEAACGLRVTTDGTQVVRVEGNPSDVMSNGHVCAKGVALGEMHADPKRLRKPLMRVDGRHIEVPWNTAFEAVRRGLGAIRKTQDANAVAVYLGNPTVHNVGLAMGINVFIRNLRTSSIYSAASVDQLPKQVANELMFGNDLAWPVPDIDRTDCLLMLGANPLVSNGSLWVVPGFRQKARALQQRGGLLITVDPRLTETGRIADWHHLIRPGADAWFLIALINHLRKAGHSVAARYQAVGVSELLGQLGQIERGDALARCGMETQEFLRTADAFASAKRAVVYGRIGTTLQGFGTLTSFLIEVVNVLKGSFDAPGGAMFPEQPYTDFGRNKIELSYDRYQSRVSQRPEVAGQLPLSVLAEEILTPGDGQIRGLVCFAGNPVLSGPNSQRMREAIESLDFHVSVDLYRNQTNATADVILPGASPFEESHYDHYFGSSGHRNVARSSQPLLDRGHRPDEWEIGLSLALATQPDVEFSAENLHSFEDDVIAGTVQRYVADSSNRLYGRDPQEVFGAIKPTRGVERMLDLGIRAGRWGDGFGDANDEFALTLETIDADPDGIDLGELRGDRLADISRHPRATIDLAPSVILAEIGRLQTQCKPDGLRLIGRRNVATNNSWLDLPMLTKGRPVDFIEIHEDDAHSLGIADAQLCEIEGNGVTIAALARLSRNIARGVVCLPHGHVRTNYNALVSDREVDEPSGAVAFNGMQVSITPVSG